MRAQKQWLLTSFIQQASGFHLTMERPSRLHTYLHHQVHDLQQSMSCLIGLWTVDGSKHVRQQRLGCFAGRQPMLSCHRCQRCRQRCLEAARLVVRLWAGLENELTFLICTAVYRLDETATLRMQLSSACCSVAKVRAKVLVYFWL